MPAFDVVATDSGPHACTWSQQTCESLNPALLFTLIAFAFCLKYIVKCWNFFKRKNIYWTLSKYFFYIYGKFHTYVKVVLSYVAEILPRQELTPAKVMRWWVLSHNLPPQSPFTVMTGPCQAWAQTHAFKRPSSTSTVHTDAKSLVTVILVFVSLFLWIKVNAHILFNKSWWNKRLNILTLRRKHTMLAFPWIYDFFS